MKNLSFTTFCLIVIFGLIGFYGCKSQKKIENESFSATITKFDNSKIELDSVQIYFPIIQEECFRSLEKGGSEFEVSFDKIKRVDFIDNSSYYGKSKTDNITITYVDDNSSDTFTLYHSKFWFYGYDKRGSFVRTPLEIIKTIEFNH